MNRRSFLGTLMASVAGAALAPKSLLWMPDQALALPVLQPYALVTLDMIAYELSKRLGNLVSLPVVESANGLHIGESGMTHQYHVDWAAPHTLDAYGLDPDRYLTPIATLLAGEIQHKRWRAFGELPLPLGAEQAFRVTSKRDGVSVRAIKDYSVGDGVPYLRFDVIGVAA